MEEMKKLLNELLAKVTGLYGIIISDRDGVPLIKVLTDKAPEPASRPNFISTFGLAIDQGGKLNLGKTTTLICTYAQYQVIQMNKFPVIITFIASDLCTTGHVLALEKQIEPIIQYVSLAVTEQ